MIVGGLLASGLALGMGTASADTTTCKSGDTTYDISGALSLLQVVGGQCKPLLPGGVLADLLNGLPVVGKAADTAGSAADTVTDTTKNTPSDPPKDPSTTTSNSATSTPAKDGSKSTDESKSVTTNPAGQGVKPLAGPAPAPFVAPPAVAAAGPLGVFSPAALGGIAPAGLASNLFGANAYDPGLLFGSPLGGAAAQLFNPKAGSGVTTVSQAQVLAAPSRGYGTPATIGVIILACLIGFAVRHRVISRMKARDLPEETAPRHAAPEVEQIDEDSDARTTVLTR